MQSFIIIIFLFIILSYQSVINEYKSLLTDPKDQIILVGLGIYVILIIAIGIVDLSSYLHLEDGFLERRSPWKQISARERIVLREMADCKIDDIYRSTGSGGYRWHGFIFTPKPPRSIVEYVNIIMPRGCTQEEKRVFLETIQKELGA